MLLFLLVRVTKSQVVADNDKKACLPLMLVDRIYYHVFIQKYNC